MKETGSPLKSNGSVPGPRSASPKIHQKSKSVYNFGDIFGTERLRFEPLSVRHRTDLIETYKYINNKYKTPPQTLFSVPNRGLR